MSKKREYTVKLEGKDPIDVVKKMVDILSRGENDTFIYEVTDNELNKSYSVDLTEEDYEYSVIPI